MQTCENCKGVGFVPLFFVWFFVFIKSYVRCGVCLGHGVIPGRDKFYIGGQEVSKDTFYNGL